MGSSTCNFSNSRYDRSDKLQMRSRTISEKLANRVNASPRLEASGPKGGSGSVPARTVKAFPSSACARFHSVEIRTTQPSSSNTNLQQQPLIAAQLFLLASSFCLSFADSFPLWSVQETNSAKTREPNRSMPFEKIKKATVPERAA